MKVGYNHAEVAQHYLSQLDLTISVSDYPILFHLLQIEKDTEKPLTILISAATLVFTTFV